MVRCVLRSVGSVLRPVGSKLLTRYSVGEPMPSRLMLTVPPLHSGSVTRLPLMSTRLALSWKVESALTENVGRLCHSTNTQVVSLPACITLIWLQTLQLTELMHLSLCQADLAAASVAAD